MKIADILFHLESLAPISYQEDYDNAGLILGNPQWECSGVLCTLDVVPDVISEAITQNCNLIVCHHPIIFRGVKRITGNNYVERSIIAAIKNDIAIYAIHTNLDNILTGVNGKMADKLGLINRKALAPKKSVLNKLFTFVPVTHLDRVRNAVFAAGAGKIGNYSECSFTVEGHGSFKADEGSNPFVGKTGERHYEQEARFEVIFPAVLQREVISALIESHPYEEVAYDIVEVLNRHAEIGSGLIGDLPDPLESNDFLLFLKNQFQLTALRHTSSNRKTFQKVAICGGAGSFLIQHAKNAKADVFITADIKYHEFFDRGDDMMICDIGHFESEQFTIDLLVELILQKFPNFAVQKSGIRTNPVRFF